VAVTVAGYGGLVWIALAPPLALWAKIPWFRTTMVTAGCVWTSDLLATGLKAAVDRPRPFQVIAEPEPLITNTVASSFPSGHAATSAAGAVILSALVGRGVWRWLTLLAVLIGFSRVYVGVHYPGDVLAGALLGAAVALGFLRLLRLTSTDPRRSAAARPPG
jgi:membrane-associated phospholipid phosphatase